jgi:hypothetical protein
MRATVACVLLLALLPATARAEIGDPETIDGPSADVVEAGDAAMAEDGSGGIVYLKNEGGRKHVFAAQFVDGAWGTPQRIDVGQAFDSTWPRIGAGNHGRLLVTWVQEFGSGTDRMFSATLDPGARQFQAPVPVDLNVGEATASYPDLSMNAGGQAYLSYFVVTEASPAFPPGYVLGSVRVARYGNRLWSVLGSAVNRNPSTPIRLPLGEATAPKVAIDMRGNALVAWLEPDDEFVDRVWARRVFGGSVGIPLLASPSSWEGAPLRGAADAFGIDSAGFGAAAVALRQQPGQSGKLTAPRIFVSEISDAFTPTGAAFTAARTVDGATTAPGAPSVGVDPNGAFAVAFSSGAATILNRGVADKVGTPERIDEGASSVAGEPLVDLAETGASVVAWHEQRGSGGGVGVLERRADGVDDPALLSTAKGGTVANLHLGGSGLGDAILTWTQGTGANAQIAAAVIDAPPDPFNVEAPEGWKRQAKVTVHWPEATNAVSPVVYSVSVDDEPVGKRTKRLFAQLKTPGLGEGRHRIQIFAIDDAGQETGSRHANLLIDRRPPKVALRRHGRRVTVAISDGSRRGTSGVKSKTVKVSFGDGSGGGNDGGAGGGGRGGGETFERLGRGRGKKGPIVATERHRFQRPGSYRVVVTARDRAGNVTRFERRVKVG